MNRNRSSDKKKEKSFTESDIVSAYLEMKKRPYHNLNPPACHLLELLGIKVPKSTIS